MSRIRGTDTGPERLLRELLWRSGLRYRLQFRTPGGRADIALPGRKIAIFIDGCFWHGCPEHYVRPRSRNEFWDHKLEENVLRDRRQTLALDAAGWTVIRLWEHSVSEDAEAAAKLVMLRADTGVSRKSRQWRVVRVVPDTAGPDSELRYLEDVRSALVQRVEAGRRQTRKQGRVRRRSVPIG